MSTKTQTEAVITRPTILESYQKSMTEGLKGKLKAAAGRVFSIVKEDIDMSGSEISVSWSDMDVALEEAVSRKLIKQETRTALEASSDDNDVTLQVCFGQSAEFDKQYNELALQGLVFDEQDEFINNIVEIATVAGLNTEAALWFAEILTIDGLWSADKPMSNLDIVRVLNNTCGDLNSEVLTQVQESLLAEYQKLGGPMLSLPVDEPDTALDAGGPFAAFDS